MPTISPACDLEVEAADGVAPLVVLGEQAGDLERRPALRRDRARRRRAHDRVADHHRRHLAGRDGADLAAADPGAAPQHGEVVAERLDLAELVADHHDGDFAAVRHVAQQAEHLVRLARRQHRGRLVEDEEALVEIEQLQDLELLLLAGRQARDRHVERHAERHPVEEGLQRPCVSLRQSMTPGASARLMTRFSAAVSDGTSVKC